MMLSLFSVIFVILCIYAALIDIETLTIPNWLNGWLAFLVLPALIVSAPGWGVSFWHLLIGLIAFSVTVVLFFVGIIGGGDAKMIPAVMLWLGPAASMPFIVATAFAGGMLTVIVIIARLIVPENVTPSFGVATLKQGRGVPYGVAIAIGALFAAPYSPLLSDFISQISSFY